MAEIVCGLLRVVAAHGEVGCLYEHLGGWQILNVSAITGALRRFIAVARCQW